LTDEVEEDLKILGVRNWNKVARDWKEWRRSVSEPRSTTDCDARGGGEEKEEVYHISFCSTVECS